MTPTIPFRRSSAPWILERLVLVIARLAYRVRTGGYAQIPAEGGVLIVANHLSYADPVLLQMACPRPIRFVGTAGLAERYGIFRWIYRLSGTVRISQRHALSSVREVSAALQQGEVVCIFPEGEISRTGQLMRLRRGFEVMARRAQVPIMPVAHDGIWGSIFSFSGHRYLFKSPRLMRTAIYVAWGRPIPPEEISAARVRQDILDLGRVAFDERPQLKRHLGREIVRGLAKRPWREEIVDRTAERRGVKAGQILGVVAALSRRIKRTIPERRVGIVLPPGVGGMMANLAVVCAGKIPVNLNFTAGRAALEASMRLGEVTTVISANAMKSKIPDFPWPERVLDLKAEIVAMGGKRAILPWLVGAWILPNQIFANLLGLPKRGDQEEAGLLFTSGSSGEPKGVIYTHRNILSNCWQISSLSILPASGRLIACLPLFHSFGFTVTLWYPMMRGCRVISVPSALDARGIVDAIREEEATVIVGAPTFLRPILRKAESRDLRSLNLVVCGAEKMPEDLHASFLKRFHLDMMQGYGLTETSPVSSVNQPNPPMPGETSDHQEGQRLGSVGRLLPGMTARIFHPDTMEVLPATETGIVGLKGSNVFAGYLHDPEKTDAAFRDGWFVTGDLGRIDEDGFLHIEGRLSRFSKIGGEMVPHGTVEQMLVEAFDIDQSEGYRIVVMGVPDQSKGEALAVLTTLDLEAGDVRTKLLERGLPNLWVPRQLVKTEAIPILGTGKLDLKGCRTAVLKALNH